jgi:hypothetical protein
VELARKVILALEAMARKNASKKKEENSVPAKPL